MHRWLPRARRFARPLPWLFSIPVLGAVALPQGGNDELKVPLVPRAVSDVKSGAPSSTSPLASDPREVCAESPAPAEDGTGRRELDGFRPPDPSSLVLFDEPGDGALWAVGGGRYKARFDAAGATYVPYFGASSPRNFPIAFALEDVRVGDRSLGFARGVNYERAGDTVLYDRGSVVEFYELRPEGMEQEFLFQELPKGGELVLRVALHTELVPFASAAGIELANDHGRVGYSRAIALDARGRQGATQTTLDGGVVEIRVDPGFLATAAWPVTIDPLVSTFDISVDSTLDAFNPDIAYDDFYNRYTVVWEQSFSSTDHDVYSLFLTSTGSIVNGSEVTVDVSFDCWTEPKVASNGLAHRFLTVAQTSTDCATPYKIEGRSRGATGTSQGSQFLISPDFVGDKIRPDVGGDPIGAGPTYFCVVWERVYSDSDHDIHYQLVNTNDTLFFPSTQYVDNSSDTIDAHPAISKSDGQRPFSSQQWNVVWSRNAGLFNNDVYGAQVHWDGDLTHGTFPVDTSTSNDSLPRVSSLVATASTEREYMVVYARGTFAGTRDVMARMMRGNTLLTPATNLTAMEGSYSGEEDILPVADADADCVAVLSAESYNGSADDYDIQAGTFRYSQGTHRILPQEVHVTLASSVDRESWPAISSTQSGSDGTPSIARRFAAAWLDEDVPGTGDGDIEGALYNSVCPAGLALCFGDGSGTACPCGNNGTTGRGCRNSTGFGGRLSGTGSNVIGGASLHLVATGLPVGQPGLFFQGTAFVNSGSGSLFGDGLRCCGSNVVRLQVSSNTGGTATSTVDIVSIGGVQAGDVRCYQYWYRDPTGGPCGAHFNLTNAYEVDWR